MTIALKWKISTATQRADCALEQAGRGVEIDGVLRWEVGRWRNGEHVMALVGVVLALNHLQGAILRPPLTLLHQGNLAHRESVYHGDRQGAYTRLVLHNKF